MDVASSGGTSKTYSKTRRVDRSDGSYTLYTIEYQKAPNEAYISGIKRDYKIVGIPAFK